VLGYLIHGVNVVIPAHYHGSTVGVTLAFMGLAYVLLPTLGFGRAEGRMAIWQPYVYGAGQLIHVLGLAWSGGYGVQRKVAGAEQMLTTLPQKVGMGMMGLGGLIAVIGGLMFVLVCLQAMSRRNGDEAQHALGLAVAAGMATLATIGWLGYRLLEQNRLPAGHSPGLISSQQYAAGAGAGRGRRDHGADAARSRWASAGHGPVAGQGPGGQLLGQLVRPVRRGNAGFFAPASRYAAQGVQFVGIGIDEVEKLRTSSRRRRWRIPCWSAIRPAPRLPALQVKGLPYTVVIDRRRERAPCDQKKARPCGFSW
jgi:hypothetical protein